MTNDHQVTKLVVGISLIIVVGIIDAWWDYRKYKKKNPDTTFKEWWDLPEDDDEPWWG